MRSSDCSTMEGGIHRDFFGFFLVGDGNRMMHLVIVVDFDEVCLLGDDRTAHFAGNRLEEIFVGGNTRAHDRAVVNVEENVQNGHHSARIVLHLGVIQKYNTYLRNKC